MGARSSAGGVVMAALVILPFASGAVDPGPTTHGEWVIAHIRAHGPFEARTLALLPGDGVAMAQLNRLDGSHVARSTFHSSSGKAQAYAGLGDVQANGPTVFGAEQPFAASLDGVVEGEAYVVFVAAGPGATLSWSLTGATVLAVVGGESVHYSDGKDFRGGASLGSDTQSTRVAAETGRSRGLDVEGVLVGQFGRTRTVTGLDTGTLTLEGPDGVETCPCGKYALLGASAMRAGHYELDHENVEATALSQEYLFWGADVHLPTT